MKWRFPLFAKILALFLANLLALGVAGLFIAGPRFRLDSLLAGRAGDRVDALALLVDTELRDAPRENWDGILQRFGAAYHVRLLLYRNDGQQIAGTPTALPHEVIAQLERPRPVFPRSGPPPQDEQQPDQPPLEPAPPLDPLHPNLPPSATHPKSMLRTTNPTRYWVIVRMGVSTGPRRPLAPATLIAGSETLSAGGLFFDPLPAIATGAGAILFSALLWLPFVRGVTRSIAQMTRATERIAEGKFDARVDEVRRDELGALGGAVNRMAARLGGFVSGQKRFLGDIAHELCSPLARAQMALGILEQRGDETQRGHIGDVREEFEQMSALVNELLSFSKASLGARIRLQAVPLRPVAEKAVAREAHDAASVAVAVDENLSAKVDPDLLLRALSNLVRNAVRYAGDAGPVTISATQDAGSVTIRVSDDGPGIPAEALAQIFDPFFRLDPARARETGGSGLGLAIVKTCVESCGGSVTARNREPRGLEVAITLQAAE